MNIKTHHLMLFALTLALLSSGCAAKFDYKDPVAEIPMVFVQGGTYMMGSDSHTSSQPVHEVTIPDLYVGIYEITFDQYDAFCKSTNCEPPSDEGWGRGMRPVINVSWHDANAFATWMSEQTGEKYRLPSEAEWEYFARAGTTTRYWVGNDLPKGIANCAECGSKLGGKITAPVGSFKPNPWGIYDTMGNVTEWVLDDYKRGYEQAPKNGKPFLNKDSNRKVQRGGSWSYNDKYLQSATRDYRRTNSHNNDAGFRLVLIPNENMKTNKQ